MTGWGGTASQVAGDRFSHAHTFGGMKSNRSVALLIFGIVLIVIGAQWTLQGIGVIAGSAMSGSTLWAIVGPIVAIVGIYLLVRWGQVRRS